MDRDLTTKPRRVGAAPAWVGRLRWFDLCCGLFAVVLLLLSRMPSRVPISVLLGVPLLVVQIAVGVSGAVIWSGRNRHHRVYRRPLLRLAGAGILINVAAIAVSWTGDWGC